MKLQQQREWCRSVPDEFGTTSNHEVVCPAGKSRQQKKCQTQGDTGMQAYAGFNPADLRSLQVSPVQIETF